MQTPLRAIATIAVLAAGPAFAEDRLSGTDIRVLLTDAWVSYDGARQHFLADGTTRYYAPEESLGFWTVERDQYCSRWPPSGSWTCYDMVQAEDGSLVWVDPEGGRSRGRREAD
ncbi:MAG: hypothetical protein AAF371_16520 [Pseudomonadota bacterium]